MGTGKSAYHPNARDFLKRASARAREARIGDPGACATCAGLNAGATQTDALKTKDAGLKAAATFSSAKSAVMPTAF